MVKNCRGTFQLRGYVATYIQDTKCRTADNQTTRMLSKIHFMFIQQKSLKIIIII